MTSSRFSAFDQHKSLSDLEKEIIAYWKKEHIFKRSVDERPKDNEFVFFDGPPFATGVPHYGHILQGTIKDILPRYKTMKGYRVERRFGWDCHGVPVEFQVEKENKIGGKPGIEALGVGKFNEMCRSIVLRCADDWKATIDRMGRFVDYDNDYKTMQPEFMESVWHVFKDLWQKDLIYEGEKVLPYSPKLGSPLSNFEADQNYQDIDDPAVTVEFQLEGVDNQCVLAWTTTPWTLPSNVALGFGRDTQYSLVTHDNGKNYWVATQAIERYFGEEAQVIETKIGKDFFQQRYLPLFPFFNDRTEERFICIYDEGDYISTDAGTGIVHFAPSFGAEDADLCAKFNVYGVNPIGEDGYFDHHIPALQGYYFREDPVVEGTKEKNANLWVLDELKNNGNLFKREQVRHRYPHCYRTDCALMYRGVRTWFVNIQKIKPNLLKNKENTEWVPSHIKHGRFGKGLETAPDWAISRNRYWGTPIPVWRDEDGHIEVIGSKEELEQKTGNTYDDLHRHFIDDATWTGPNGKPMRRIEEVLDCWFESGSMPYASKNYPFSTDKIQKADFIAEGIDQTRCWFYNLHVLGTALFDTNMFDHVITSGLVLAEDGSKMSKSKKNYPDPSLIFEEYGADAMRYYLVNSPVVKGENLRFTKQGVAEVIKSVILPLRSAYQFLSTYATIDQWTPSHEGMPDSDNELDIWILSELQNFVKNVENGFDEYDLEKSVRNIPKFIDHLTNWYIRQSRKRFWASGMNQDKENAYQTLYFILRTMSQVIAPVMPFLAEQLWHRLGCQGDSVHLSLWPQYDESRIQTKLEHKMQRTRDIVKLAAMIRAQKKIKLRQPLQKLQFALTEDLSLDMDVIRAEANVKHVEILDSLEGIAEKRIYVDARKVGKKLGKKVQVVLQAGKNGIYKEHPNGLIEIENEMLNPDEYAVQYTCQEGFDADSADGVVVVLDTNITPQLQSEGFAREIIRAIQETRKNNGFEVSDNIAISYQTQSESLIEAFESHSDFICQETLGISITAKDNLSEDSIIVDGETLVLSLQKA